MTNVLTLHQERPVSDVPRVLRQIADEIDAGDIDFPITTAVLVVGHVGGEIPEGMALFSEVNWQTYGFGPRSDVFSVRGLMATALNRWGHDD